MKIGLYQMINHGHVIDNFQEMKKGIIEAKNENCDVVVFPECALTGYPPIELKSISSVTINEILNYEEKLADLSKFYDMFIIFGTIRYENRQRYNSLKVIDNQGTFITHYDKRALWGYDLQNFTMGDSYGKVNIKGITIGLSICFEIRFPEFYREHKSNDVDIMLTCFCDVSEQDSLFRCDLIKGHIQTRAVENVLPHLSVNSASKYQTAPTAVYSIIGSELMVAEKNISQLIAYVYEKPVISYGPKGIKEVSSQIASFSVSNK